MDLLIRLIQVGKDPWRSSPPRPFRAGPNDSRVLSSSLLSLTGDEDLATSLNYLLWCLTNCKCEFVFLTSNQILQHMHHSSTKVPVSNECMISRVCWFWNIISNFCISNLFLEMLNYWPLWLGSQGSYLTSAYTWKVICNAWNHCRFSLFVFL